MSRQLLFQRITNNGSMPYKSSKYSAGYTIKSAYDYYIPKRGQILVSW
jgi:hypothetical protein